MFGKNKLMKQEHGEGRSLSVKEIFHTVQGEGPYAGRPAVFIRLAGCNLKCWFCDTDFENGIDVHTTSIIAEANEYKKKYGTNLIVLTGGEPLRQPLKSLLLEAYIYGFRVQIETAGTLFQEALMPYRKDIIPGFLTVVCSPKTGKLNKLLAPHIDAYKYIIRVGEVDHDGLPCKSTQSQGGEKILARPPAEFAREMVYVQPMDEQDEALNQANTELAAKIAMQKGYTLCLQMHKIANLP